MKRIVKLGVTLLFTFLALDGLMLNVAWADSGEYKNYGQLGLGFNQFSADLDDAGYDRGIASYATYGRYLTKNLVVEGTFGIFHTSQDFSGSTGVAGSYTRDDSIDVNSFRATLKSEIPVGPVTLYGGAGLGIYIPASEEVGRRPGMPCAHQDHLEQGIPVCQRCLVIGLMGRGENQFLPRPEDN